MSSMINPPGTVDHNLLGKQIADIERRTGWLENPVREALRSVKTAQDELGDRVAKLEIGLNTHAMAIKELTLKQLFHLIGKRLLGK